jgi:hypothetical protein
MKTIEDLYRRSDLPGKPDVQKAEDLLINIREQFYGDTN